MGRNRSTSDVFSYTVFRPSKAAENSVRYFQPLPQSIAPMRIAFIGTRGTASASELVINGVIPGASRRLLAPERPTTAQREVPGLF